MVSVQYPMITRIIKISYEQGITDEFIKPIVISENNKTPNAKIMDGDLVVFFNFRTDRGRQLTEVLTQYNLDEFGMRKMNLSFLTMTSYNDDYENVSTIYENENLKDTLGEVLANKNKKQIRIAETEKYPHVTFFLMVALRKNSMAKREFYVSHPKLQPMI